MAPSKGRVVVDIKARCRESSRRFEGFTTIKVRTYVCLCFCDMLLQFVTANRICGGDLHAQAPSPGTGLNDESFQHPHDVLTGLFYWHCLSAHTETLHFPSISDSRWRQETAQSSTFVWNFDDTSDVEQLLRFPQLSWKGSKAHRATVALMCLWPAASSF